MWLRYTHKYSNSTLLQLVVDRLQCNETLLQVLQSALHNSDLERLEEILLKRINYDQDILAQLNYLIRSNTSIQFTVAEDPIVSQILVLFSKGYEKLLKIIPDVAIEEDICSNHSSTSSAARGKLIILLKHDKASKRKARLNNRIKLTLKRNGD